MTRQRVLLRLVKFMFAVLALGFVYVLFRSLSGPSLVGNPARVFDDIEYGQTALRRYQGQRVWVTRLNPALRRQADSLHDDLADSALGCVPKDALCVVSASTERSGIEIVFSHTPPAQLPAGVPWFGGFVDPVSGAVFDRLGRVYQVTADRHKSASLVVISVNND